MELAQKQTKATKKNSSFVSFVPFCSKEIRVIRAIRGKTFAKMNDSYRLRRNVLMASNRAQSEIKKSSA